MSRASEPAEAVSACHLPAYGIHDGARVLVCSVELAKMFGESSPEAIEGRDAISFIAPASLDRSITAIALSNGGPYRSMGIKADGAEFPIEIHGFSIRYRRGAARLFTVRDLSPLAVIVDDETAVGRLTGALMRRIGYQTVVCTEAKRALSAVQPNVISVLVSDIVMPEMDGQELVAQARKLDPELPVVFVSGFTDCIPEQDERTRFLSKPFTANQLTEALNSLPERARATLV